MSLFKFSIVVFALLLLEVSQGLNQGRRSKRASAIGPKWPTKRIPFAFDNIEHFDANNRAKIKHALKLFQESLNVDGETCLEFVERSNESDYIQFVKEDGCFTYVGYRPGKNVISLGPKCIQTDIVMHEIVHKIGFDHEHSSSNRDQYIQVLLNHTNSASQFTQNHAQSETELDAPYDFHSIVHYSSYDGSNHIFGSRPVLLSKLPVLISTSNEIEFQSNLLTPIDVYKIQRFYGCRTIPVPDIVQASNETAEKDRFDTVITRFTLEGSFKRISSDVMTKYLEKSIKVCGFNHYWPVNYPLVESNHPLYKLMCLRKKKKNERCKFSFECLDDKTICLRPFYWPTGFCVRSENAKINLALQKSHDTMIKFGDMIKKTFSPKA